MYIIAENLNSSIKKVEQALKERNSIWLLEQAKQIAANGADYLDINAGTFLHEEAEVLLYLANTVKSAGLPFVIDSPDADTIAYILNKTELKNQMLNSITLEPKRFEKISELALAYDSSLIALLMDEDKMPEGIEQRMDIAERIIAKLQEKGISEDRILLDPMIRPLATDDQAGKEALEVIKLLKTKHPNVHIVVGLSNLSFGLPARKYLNQAFLIQAMAMGLDSAICNPLDKDLMSLYNAAKSLAGNDEYCCDYLEFFRPVRD